MFLHQCGPIIANSRATPCGVAAHPSGELTLKSRGGDHRHPCDDSDEHDTAAARERGGRKVRDDGLIRAEELWNDLCAANACGD
jgi:hypothetical protein